MARPNPVPPTPWVASSWARKNGVNSCAWSSGARPTPVSWTATRTRPASPRAVITMRPPALELWAQHSGDLLDQVDELQRPALQLDLTSLEAREIQEIVDQRDQPLRITLYNS